MINPDNQSNKQKNKFMQQPKIDAFNMAQFLIGFFFLGAGLFYGNLMMAGSNPFVVAVPSVVLSLVGAIIFREIGSIFWGVLSFYLLVLIMIFGPYLIP